jgi:hypothetical protein
VARDLPLLSNVQTGSGAHRASYTIGTVVLPLVPTEPPIRSVQWFFLWCPQSLLYDRYSGSSSGITVPRPPFISKVKNEWKHTSTPPVCLSGVESDKLYFILPQQLIWKVKVKDSRNRPGVVQRDEV